MFDQHVAGDVQLMLNWPMTSYDKRIAVIYTPICSPPGKRPWPLTSQWWLNETLDGIYKENGLKFFGAWPEGFNGVATKGKHAVTVEDARNIKVQVPRFP